MKTLSFQLVNPSAAGLPPDGSVIQLSALGEGVTSYTENGKVHVYKRVYMADLISSSDATITSSTEQSTIYNEIATQCGWLGGTRMLASNGSGGYQKIADESSLARLKDSANADLTNKYSRPANYDTETTGEGGSADQWYWADGPEAGTVYYAQHQPKVHQEL